MSENQRPKRLTAQKKFELYLETRGSEAPLGEILRRYGVHPCLLADRSPSYAASNRSWSQRPSPV
ncbi:MAG: hypothetical protein H8D78_22730 [Chloroflexi bacterium]|nr:hypothetical protein [Chloroflexota bacterium]